MNKYNFYYIYRLLLAFLCVLEVSLVSAANPIQAQTNSQNVEESIIQADSTAMELIEMFGDGRDGVMPSSGNLDNNNGVGIGSVEGTKGATRVIVTNRDSISRVDPGDIVLLHNTKGSNAGCWELNRAVSNFGGGTATYTLENPIICDYSNAGSNRAQILRVPQYSSCNVSGRVTPLLSWDGTKGGIFAVMCNGDMNIEFGGVIDLAGKGYRGFEKWTSPTETGYQGEGISGSVSQSTSANRNGGGGGQGYDDGGGGGSGGSHASNGSVGALRPGGGPSNGAAATTLLGNDALSPNIFFGGAGGAGGSDDSAGPHTEYPCGMGGKGGNGGGIAMIYARSVTHNGTITADGENGGNGGWLCSGGAGGGGGGAGGAGGSILIKTETLHVNSNRITAVGGNGGSRVHASGTGGNGGRGRIRVEYCNEIIGNVNQIASTRKLSCPTPTPTVTDTPTPTNTPTPTDTPVRMPDIRITPEEFSVTLPEGQATTIPLIIHNAGDANLIYSAQKQNTVLARAANMASPASAFSLSTDLTEMFGDGSDGAMPNSGNLNNNKGFGAGSVSGSAGSTRISVTDRHAVWRIGPGDVVLIHQSQGTNAGRWELNKAATNFTGNGTFTLENALKYTYSSTGNNRAQILRVPQYSTCNVSGTVTPLGKWNGTWGGIFAVMCTGTLKITGKISANGGNGSTGTENFPAGGSGYGFRGGQGDAKHNDDHGTGYHGEGISGIFGMIHNDDDPRNDSPTYSGLGPNSNGGGAGSGKPSTGNFGTGGGGGNRTAGGNGQRGGMGVGGTAAGNAQLTSMVHGGGGGGSNDNPGNSIGGGGGGGGIIFLSAPTISLTGQIEANGGSGGGSKWGAGGGAGGSIFLRGKTVALGTSRVSAVGGGAGNYGGRGGSGRIRVEYCTRTTGSTSPNSSSQKLTCVTPTPPPPPTPPPTLPPTPPPTEPPKTPDIRVTPDEFSRTLPEGQVTTVPLIIHNAGNANLTWTMSKQDSNLVQAASTTIQKLPHDKIDSALSDALNQNGQATFLTYLTEQADLTIASQAPDRATQGQQVYDTLLEVAQRTQVDLLSWLAEQKTAGHVSDYRSFFIMNVVAVTGDINTVNALAQREDVAYIELERIYTIPEPEESHDVAAAAINGIEWNLGKIRAGKAWQENVDGTGILVGVIDTGTDHTHPALAIQYSCSNNNHDYCWYDPTGYYPTAPGDNNGHGTHTTGTIVGSDGGSNQIGVAPGARWIAVKGCGDTSCNESHLLSAFEWMLAPCPIGIEPGSPQCDPSKRPHVVNNSWGGNGGKTYYQNHVDAWRAAGIFPVFSAGNSGRYGSGTVGSPGDYANTCSVGATDSQDRIAPFSSRGPSRLTRKLKPDVSAPGVNIRSALPGGGYGLNSGTSMAAPHVAGTVALLLQANPQLRSNFAQIETILASTAVDLGRSGPDYDFGYGRIDAYAAVQAAKANQPWLTYTPSSGTVVPAGRNTVQVTFNAAGLEPGTYETNLVINSNDPDTPSITIPVVLNVGAALPQISHIREANLTNNSATISWITNAPASGKVRYGTDPFSLDNTAEDVRGGSTRDDIHYVKLSNLTPNTVYFYSVISGGSEDDNDGQLYQFTTGSTLSVPSTDSVYGKVLKSDGTPAANVLIHLRVMDNDGNGTTGRSASLAGMTDNTGYWYDLGNGGAINLGGIRSENHNSYFVYGDGDQILVEIEGSEDCGATKQFDLSDFETNRTSSGEFGAINGRQAPEIRLSCLQNVNVVLSRGWSAVAFPFAQFNYSADALMDDASEQGNHLPSVCYWNAVSGNWVCKLPDTPFGDFPIQSDTPYFILSDEPTLLQFEGGIG